MEIEFTKEWAAIDQEILKIASYFGEPCISWDEKNIRETIILNVHKIHHQKSYDSILQMLYRKILDSVRDYYESKVLLSLNKMHDELLLREFVRRWYCHKKMVRWLQVFLSELDWQFDSSDYTSTINFLDSAFRTEIYDCIHKKVSYAICTLIDKEREGKEIDKSLITSVVEIYIDIGSGISDCYERDFEKIFLQRSIDYYSSKGSEWSSCSEFMEKVDECLTAEKHRLSNYFPSSTEQQLMEKVQREVLSVYALCHLDNKQTENLTLIRKGKALEVPFEDFCDEDIKGSSFEEILAMFFDLCLTKSGMKILNEKAAEKTINKVLKFVSYVPDKEKFAEFYWKRLARRLLYGESHDHDLEKYIVTKLGRHCGANFVWKINRMVSDLTDARNIKLSFQKHLNLNPQSNPGIEFSGTILRSGLWPSRKSPTVRLPQEMVNCIGIFTEFYRDLYKEDTRGRRLNWLHSLGCCHIIGNFDTTSIEIIVNPYQACILMLFNAADKLRYSEVISSLDLPEDFAKQLLHSLSCGKYNLLKKEPDNNSILPTDFFAYNSNFSCKEKWIKAPLLQLPPLNDEKNGDGEDAVSPYAIDAAIVRIMKNWKVMEFKDLMRECAKLRFKPTSNAIKRRLDVLIDKEYLERDENNPSLFRYIS